MAGSMKGLKESWKYRKESARKEALEAIQKLRLNNEKVNFNSVSKISGVSKSFLYDDAEIRKEIEQIRKIDINTEINQRARYDKTSKSKDIIIEAKDKRIAKLEEENRKLKKENESLRGLLYQQV